MRVILLYSVGVLIGVVTPLLEYEIPHYGIVISAIIGGIIGFKSKPIARWIQEDIS